MRISGRFGNCWGLDLDEEAENDLRQAKADREAGNKNEYFELDSV